MAEKTGGFEGRAAWIDGLRGIAALGVACYHILRYPPLNEQARQCVPNFLNVLIDHGWVGVQVFFVISGFVIAYSVRHAFVTPFYVLQYALRRSVRLDPPYWTTIAFVLLVHAVWQMHLGWVSPLDIPEDYESVLSWKVVGLHMVYLQGITRHENLSAGFWSLCIEVQFYLMFVSGVGIAQRFPYQQRATPEEANPWGLLTVFAPLALCSLFIWNTPGAYDNDMYIIRFFCMFFLGAAIWWTLDRRIPAWVFWVYVVLFLSRILFVGFSYGWSDKLTIALSVALIAGLATYAAGVRGQLGRWLNIPVVQYLGRISYSLYLIHFPISHIVKTIGHQISGDEVSPIVALLWQVLCLACSIGVADVMYRFIEAPSLRLASWLKRQPSEKAAA